MLGSMVALALLIRLVPVLRGGGLFGAMTYDDGVYFGSALALVGGRIPYRDFLLLHPPGVVLLMTPFAALANVVGDASAFALARLGFMVIGAVNVLLVTLLAGRLGRTAGLAAGGLYVVWQIAVTVERTTWLIAPQSTVLLLALLVLAGRGRNVLPVNLSVRRCIAAGLLLGLLVGMQLWGVVPLAVIVGWLAVTGRGPLRARLRPALVVASAAAVAAMAVWGPFVVASGGTMLRYVVFDQAGRALAHAGLVVRMRYMEGLPIRRAIGPRIPTPIVITVFVTAIAAIGWAAWRRPALRLWAVLLAAQVVTLMLAPPLAHYAGWLAPTAALCVGAFVQEAIGALRMRPRLALGFRASYILVLGVLLIPSTVRPIGAKLSVAGIAASIADERCVTADFPTLLIETGTLSRDIADGCPLMLDPTGTGYDLNHAIAHSRSTNAGYQAAMAAYYGGSDAAMFEHFKGDELQPATLDAIRHDLPQDNVQGAVTVMVDGDR